VNGTGQGHRDGRSCRCQAHDDDRRIRHQCYAHHEVADALSRIAQGERTPAGQATHERRDRRREESAWDELHERDQARAAHPIDVVAPDEESDPGCPLRNVEQEVSRQRTPQIRVPERLTDNGTAPLDPTAASHAISTLERPSMSVGSAQSSARPCGWEPSASGLQGPPRSGPDPHLLLSPAISPGSPSSTPAAGPCLETCRAHQTRP